MGKIKIRCIADSNCILGEGPVWDEKKQQLYWVDILDNKIYRYESSSESFDWWQTPEHVGFLILKEQGGLICGLKSGLHHISLEQDHQTSASRIDRVDQHSDHIRYNDGICDGQGRIWGCTMDMNQEAPLGKYYCYDENLKRSVVDKGYVVANGPAVSPDGKRLYTVETVGCESIKRGIYVYDIKEKCVLQQKQFLVDWGERKTYPDGIITDRQGNIWIGEFGGNMLRCYSKHGDLLQEVEVPAWNVTKAAFGGENLDRLFVTTARFGVEEQILERYPSTGGIFEIRGIEANGFPLSHFGQS